MAAINGALVHPVQVLRQLVVSCERQVIDVENIQKLNEATKQAFEAIKATSEPMGRDQRFVEIIQANLKVLNTPNNNFEKILPPHLDETAWALAEESSKEPPLIGAGGFGFIYKMELPSGGHVALKTPRPDIDKTWLEQHTNEIKMFFSIPENPFVIGFFGVDACDGIMLAYASNKDLFAWIKARPPMCASTLHMIREIAEDCIRGIGYLHDLRIVHHDLKPENIFLMNAPGGGLKNSAKIGDFGLARLLTAEEWINPPNALVPGGFHMLPPEYIPAKGTPPEAPISIKADIWCFGGLIYMMLGRYCINMNEPQIKGPLMQGKIDEANRTVDKEIAEMIADSRKQSRGLGDKSLELMEELMRSSLQIEPKKRMNAQELIGIIAKKTL